MAAPRPVSLVAALALVAGTVVAPASAQVLSGTLEGTLGREPQLSPADLGEDALEGLQYADPTENLDLVGPPEADNQGGAAVSHPLGLPPGRAGVAPELELSYDSGGGNGWVGTGWDLSLGAVEIDTRWGAPLFCPQAGALCGEEGARDVESETYLLDGDQLSPTAVRFPFAPRVAERDDWTRRTETEYERIVRHGDSPATYWWEVTDKKGTTRWYGGTPEGTRDPGAILVDLDGNAVRWGLSAVRDISSNVMRVSYDTVVGTDVGADAEEIGTAMYVRSVLYTGSLAGGSVPDDPAYEVVFLRDDDVAVDGTTTVPDPRPDVVVDASAGALEVTSDLLRRVEVRYGSPVAAPSQRSRTQVLKAWDLTYAEGAFEKSVLTRVDQVGSDQVVVGSHTFDYYDEVGYEAGKAAGTYTGFDIEAPTWTTGPSADGDDIDQFLLAPVDVSALGASETNSGDGGAYIGFNPSNPTKTGSFGGSISVSGGGTGGLVESLDINGDLLPDKVYRRNITGAGIQYRLNTSGPDGGTTFGPRLSVTGIGTLSTEANIGISGGPEAYFGLSVQFNIAADVTIGEQYFTDVNNDGLPDYVDAGKVWFNTTTDASKGVTFDPSSASTGVPIDDGSLDLSGIEGLAEFEQLQRDSSPLQDVVRRWVAPVAGTVAVTGAVTLDPAPTTPATAYAGDGVRVAVQQGDEEKWAGNLLSSGGSVTPSGVGALVVAKGQALYFRVGSVDDGARDRVRWAPVVTYTSLGAPSTDANGLSQTRYAAADDFTLAGRPDTPVLMPLRGTVRLEGTLTKTAVTSDDVRLLVRLDKVDDADGVEEVVRTVPAAFVGDIVVSEDLDVDAPTGTGADSLVVRLAADTPVDPTVFRFDPTLHYTEAFDGTTPVPVLQDLDPTDAVGPEPVLLLDVPWDVDLYPTTDATAPVEPWSPGADGTVTAELTVTAGQVPDRLSEEQRTVYLSVKRRTATGQPGALVAKQALVLPPNGFLATTSVDAELDADQAYWFDVTARDATLSGQIASAEVVLDPGTADSTDVPETLHTSGGQGTFPLGNRGWAYAGYAADGDLATAKIDEAAFVFRQDDYPTAEPTGFDDTGYKNPAQGRSYPFTAAVLDVDEDSDPTTPAVTVPVWRGTKDSLYGGAGVVQSSRLGSDSVGVGTGSSAGAEVRGVRRVGVSAPVLGLVLGAGPLTGAFGAGPSFGLLDYVDMNGDSFPDVVAPGSITYTTPRGGYLPANAGGPSVVGQDLTLAASGGFEGTAIDVKSNSKGDANTSQDTSSSSGTAKKPSKGGSASQGGAAEAQESGANVGLAAGITAQFTNPGSPSSDLGDGVAGVGVDLTATMERELADVNGDGLPDQVSMDADGVHVRFNTGYGFSDEIAWTDGGAFENGESYGGSVGPLLGFNFNKKEFSGGLSFSEAVDQARFSWVDVDGDGVLDRVEKVGDGTKVSFGSGSGLGDEVDYGQMATGAFDLDGEDSGLFEIPLGEQVSQSRSRGVGGGFSFTIPIGPLCLPAPLCYIIVNPSVGYERSLSSTQVQLTDVDGDGAPDSVESTRDGQMTVRANTRGKTNLLQQVTNPIGGQVRLGYTRDGNTTTQPYPVWLMSSVEVDDARDGDGPQVQATTYAYSGNRYDPVEREILGYEQVVEEQRDGAAAAAVLRRTVRTYANDTVFDSGLVVSEELQGPTGTPVSRTDSTWVTTDLATGDADPVTVPTSGAQALALLDDSRGVVRTVVRQSWFDVGGALGTSTRSTYAYDDLGNVVRQVDEGQPSLAGDDVVALMTYSQCRTTSWVSQPATLTVTDAAGAVLRKRDGSTDLCLNSVPIHLEERIDDGTTAVTDLEFDDWGSYDVITYPENADGDRYQVRYVYDADRHTDVASVVDSHGLSTSASFTATGRVTERVDANGNATRYTYDAFHRLATVRAPAEQVPGSPATVAYAYFPTAPVYAYATASHHDRFNPGDPIQTAAFVDGIGRTTQTKHDTEMLADDAADPSTDEVLVGGAVEYDALGREVAQWFPTTEPRGTLGDYKFTADEYPPTRTAYTLLDQVAELAVPNGDDGTDTHVTRTAYGFGTTAGAPDGLFVTTTEDALRTDDPTTGKQQVTYSDVRDNLLVVDDAPAQAPALRTRFTHDLLGQLVRVVDSAGSVTSHTYDGLGRRLSTDTPDGGLREYRYDPAGNLTEEVTPNLRATGQGIDYGYDFDRLVSIDYPDAATGDVSYAYGDPGAPDNGAGRVVGLEDGARSQQLAYDELGNVATETTTMKVHNLSPSTRDKLTYVTGFSYDSLGRMDTLTYPDGEVLSHAYDSGGLLSGMTGAKTCTDIGVLAAAVDALSTTVTVTERATGVPAVPFTITLGQEDLLVTAREAAAVPGDFLYTVVRGTDGTPELPTAAAHPAGATVVSATPVVCSYPYLERQEYDQFLDRRVRQTGNGVLSQWAFDYIGRLEVLTTDTPVRQVQGITYSYDEVDNVLTMDNEVPAATPSLFVGPTQQDYDYDPYYRLAGATGTADVAPDKVRSFTLALTYDASGNVSRKVQTDSVAKVSGAGKPLVQTPTTYTYDMTYAGDGPHQLTSRGARTFSHDANGNLAGWVERTTGRRSTVVDSRTFRYDAEDRLVEVDNSSDDTTYAYDADGRRAIERGPDGETSFVNRWYTVRNGSVPWKNVWAGDDRLGTKRSFGGTAGGGYEHQQYYLSKDLQGSTNVVTDDTGKVFEHWEYLPGGEPWVREDSAVQRTPYLYGGGYLDDVNGLVNFGARWYEPKEGMFLTPDPILYEEPEAAMDDPSLLPAYTYAGSSPLRLVDPDGDINDAAGSGLSAAAAAVGTGAKGRSSRLWNLGGRMEATKSEKGLQAFSDRFEMKPLVQVNLVSGPDGVQLANVKVSPFGFVQPKVFKTAADTKADDAAASGSAGSPAVSPGAGTAASTGGPAASGAGGSGPDPGAATPGQGGAAATGQPAAADGSPTPASSGPSSAGATATSTSTSTSSGATGSGAGGSLAVGAADGPPVSGAP